jgi:hypothetical protein
MPRANRPLRGRIDIAIALLLGVFLRTRHVFVPAVRKIR